MISAFPQHAIDLGYRVTEPIIPDGKLHRTNWHPDDKGRSGWYAAWDHGEWGTVAWGDWKDSHSEVWTSREKSRLTAADRAMVQREIDEFKQMEAAVKVENAASAQRWAEKIWKNAEPEPTDHAYLAAKQIGGESMRIYARAGDKVPMLLVPLRPTGGTMANLQRILPDGKKLFLKGGLISGLSWRTGPMPPEDFTGDVIVTEGAATAATVRAISGSTVFAAMNSGNLPAVVRSVREKWPECRLLIAADDDRWNRNGTPRPLHENAGRVKATQAAMHTKAMIILPSWNNPAARGTDWNDLFCDEGKEATTIKWINAVGVAQLDRRLVVLSDNDYEKQRNNLLESYKQAGERLNAQQLNRRRKEARGTPGADTPADEDRPPILALRDIVNEHEIWKNQFGQAFVTMQNEGIWMNASAESTAFTDWMRTSYRGLSDEPIPLAPQVIKTMVDDTASRGRTGHTRYQTHYRFGKDPAGEFRWLDLGREDWKCVRWNADGWEVVDRADVKFIRSDATAPLPIPERNPETSGLDALWPLINTKPENAPLIAGFLLGAMKSDSPCFALLLMGQNGSAKSVSSELIRQLLDPDGTPFQQLNDVTPESLGLTCVTQWLPAFNNISHIDPEMQDTLCSLTTGFGFKTRKLYSDSGVVSCSVRRPFLINAIPNVCSRTDLAERTIPVELEVITGKSRRTEDDVRAEFELLRPHFLATLLDAAVEAERNYALAGDFLARNQSYHRMADASKWITAGEDALGFPMGTFITKLKDIQDEGGRETLEETPMMDTINLLLEESVPRNWWKGTSTMFLDTLDKFAPIHSRSKYLPKDGRSLSAWFRRERTRLLQSFGIEVTESKTTRVGSGQTQMREIRRVGAVQPPEETKDLF